MKGPFIPCDLTPEDRARGCVWASSFRSAADEVAKGGVISGDPVIQRGATFDGTGDWIEYTMNAQWGASANHSEHLEFYPDFAANVATDYYLQDSTGGRYLIYKVTGSGSLYTMANGTAILIPYGNYSPYWVQGGRNLLTLSYTSGDNTAWFNGQEVYNIATAWTPSAPTVLTIGARNTTHAGPFDGMIKSIKFYNALLTAGDHDAAWSQS